MKQLFGSEIRLQICDQKQYPGVVQGGQFIVQLGVDEVELSFDFVELFFGLHHFRLIFFLTGPRTIVAGQLVAVPLAVVVHQFPVTFVDLFLWMKKI